MKGKVRNQKKTQNLVVVSFLPPPLSFFPFRFLFSFLHFYSPTFSFDNTPFWTIKS